MHTCAYIGKNPVYYGPILLSTKKIRSVPNANGKPELEDGYHSQGTVPFSPTG